MRCYQNQNKPRQEAYNVQYHAKHKHTTSIGSATSAAAVVEQQ
jgi:hypothetical protein